MGKRGYFACRCGSILILFACILLLAGCGGKSASQHLLGSPDADAAPLPGMGNAPTGKSWKAPPLPQDAPLDPAELVQRRSNYSLVQVRLGDEPDSHNQNAVAYPATHVMQLIAGPDETAWAVYRFDIIMAEDLPAQVSVELLPAMTEHLYFGLPDYERGAWRWQQLPAGIGAYNLGIGESMHALSPAGNLYVALLCHDADNAVLTRLTCTTEVSAPPPVGLEASDGTHARIIFLTWEDPAVTYPGLDYESIIIERTFDLDDPWEELATLLKGHVAYEDYFGVEAGLDGFDQRTYYRLRTVENGNPGEPGLMDYGYRWLNYVSQIDATDGLYYDRVEISWEPVPGADKQLVLAWRYDLGGSGFGTEIGELDGQASFYAHVPDYPPDYGCTYGAVFNYRIGSMVQYGENDWCINYGYIDEGYRVLHPPQEPAASYERYFDHIELDWQKPDGATGYIVYRDGQDPGNIVATIGDVDSWSDFVADLNEHIYWLRSTTDEHTSDFSVPVIGRRSAWQTHEVTSEGTPWDCPLVVVDGKPAICFARHSKLKFAQATASFPTDAGDWIIHTLDDSTTYINSIAMAVVNGMPAIAYAVRPENAESGYDKELRYARALTATPSSASDWQIHYVDTGWWISNDCSLVELDGRPAVTYYNAASDFGESIYFAQAASTTPSDSSDWSAHEVDKYYGDVTSLAVIEGKPLFAYDRQHPTIAIAMVPNPATATDWQVYDLSDATLDENSPWISLTVVNSRLATAFIDRRTNDLIYARALVTTPLSAADWAISTVATAVPQYTQGGSLVDFGGVPAIGFSQGLIDGQGPLVCAALAGVAEPDDVTDWERNIIQYASDQGESSSSVNLAVSGSSLLVSYNNRYQLNFGIYW